MYPIIALWSHPRSMSTAMERVMRERGDLDCAHEPFMYYYYIDRQVRQMPHFEVEKDHPVAYEDVRDMLLARTEKQPVFFKDMSYYVLPRILEDEDFCKRLTNCFLIRNPIASIPSYHKLDPDVTSEEIGLEAQWKHFEALQRITGTDPTVVQAEDIRADTKGIISALWERIGLPFREEAFEWSDEKPADWDQVSGWHGNVSSSKTIRALTPEEIAAQTENFNACAKDNPHLSDYLAHHKRFYDLLKDQSLEL